MFQRPPRGKVVCGWKKVQRTEEGGKLEREGYRGGGREVSLLLTF